MSSPIQLRFEWPAGQATFELSKAEALKVVVALRGLGLGLSLKEGTRVLVTKETAKFSAAENVIKKLRSASRAASRSI